MARSTSSHGMISVRLLVCASLVLVVLASLAAPAASEVAKHKRPVSVCLDFKQCTDRCQCVKDEQRDYLEVARMITTSHVSEACVCVYVLMRGWRWLAGSAQ